MIDSVETESMGEEVDIVHNNNPCAVYSVRPLRGMKGSGGERGRNEGVGGRREREREGRDYQLLFSTCFK